MLEHRTCKCCKTKFTIRPDDPKLDIRAASLGLCTVCYLDTLPKIEWKWVAQEVLT